FLFMVVVSMPFSFGKYRMNSTGGKVYIRIIRRFCLLFLLGMIVQGNLLAFDPDHIYIYTNTLQAIAVGYLMSALIILNCTVASQVIITLSLLIAYWIPMKFCGDYSMDGNFAYAVDREIIGRFRGDLSYTWIWSSLTFTATVMFGTFAGHIMKQAGCEFVRKCRASVAMIVLGCVLILSGLMWSLEMPIIKRLWTSSMTLFSGGICFVLMAVFYYIIDCRQWSRGFGWLKIYGMNAITAYVLGEIVSFRSIIDSVSYGLVPVLRDYYSVWLTAGNYIILFFILKWMYKSRVFIKL
ncbi:MAG: DUF5009 domain-containing protein, partial [Muribaculaceae bacterium]|nr:DUF5009 domain-containing protein [Muribaculaceae bacterium]